MPWGLLLAFILVSGNSVATVYTWNTYVAGNLTYTNGNMSATVTTTAFDTRGPQDPNGGANGGYKSPKYVSAATINTYQNGMTNDYGMPGLVLGLDWTNLNSSTTVSITFLNPVAGPVSFNLYDVNVGSWGGNIPVWIDKLTISGTDCSGNTIFPAYGGCANPVSGANSNTLTGTSGCTNTTNTVTFNATAIKTITLVYASGNPLASGYGSDPDPQYVIVSDITAATIPPLTINPTPAILTCNSPTATLSTSPALPTATYNWSGGSTPAAATTTVNAAGNYSVTVTDASTGCSLSATTTVSSNISNPPVTINPDTLVITCGMAGGALAAQTTAANPNYHWSNGDTIANTVANLPGTYSVTVTDQSTGCSASAVSIVTLDTVAPGGSLLAPDTLSCAQPTIQLVATSAAPNVLFIWGGGLGTGATKNVSSPGQYTVLIKDLNNGCISRDTVDVFQQGTVPDAMILTPDSFTCLVSSVTLQAALPAQTATYHWSNGSTAASTTITTPGNYYLIVTDPVSGCADTASVVVPQNTISPAVSLNNPANLDCSNTSVSLIATTNAVSPVFAWSNGGTTATQQVSLPGTYTVTVTNTGTGCSASQAVLVNQTAVPPTASISSSGTLGCSTGSVTLTASTSASVATYAWSTGSANATAIVTTAGAYSVTITDLSSGCSASASVQVSSNAIPLQITITPPATITCAQTTVTLTAVSPTATGFVWNDGTTGTNLSVNTPAQYSVTATETATGCSASASVTVAQNTQAPAVSLATADTLSCTKTTIIISANSGANSLYSWSTGSAQATTTINAAGTYTVTVTDTTNGCSSTATTIVISNQQTPSLCVADAHLSCLQAQAVLSGLTNAQQPVFTWSSGETTSAITVSQPAIYALTVTDINNGCTASAQVAVTASLQPPVAGITGNLILTDEQPSRLLTAVSNALNATYQWSTGAIGENLTVSEPGTYTVTVDDNGCTAEASVLVTQVITHHLFVPNAFTPGGNGSNDYFRLYGDLEHIKYLGIKIFNRWGEKVFESNDHNFAWDGTYKGKVQEAQVFVWVLNLTYTDGQHEEIRKGSLTLLR